MSPRVLIFGTGAVGSTYTQVLSRKVPASNVVCVCRSNYNAVKSNGITLNSTIWGNNLHVHPVVVQSISEAATLSSKPYDYILITSKSLPSTPSTAEQLRPITSPNTTIILIQNGIRIEQPFSTLYPSNPLLSGVVYLPVTQTSPGIISHKEIELLHLGTYPSTAPTSHKTAAQTFADLLTSCSATVELHNDIQEQRWSKLLVNAAWNPICALTRSRDSEFLHTELLGEQAVEYVRDVMREIAAVARAEGYTSIDEGMVEFQIDRAVKRGLPGIQPSMLADAFGGRRMEVDAIVGNVLGIAREREVQTPLLRGLWALLAGLDGSFARVAGTGS